MADTNGTSRKEDNCLEKELPEVEGLVIRTLDDPRVVERVRILDQYCLAVKYHDQYYDKYVRPCPHQYNQLAFYHDVLVGSCTCRLEQTDNEDELRLYVMTIVVLEPYRHLGIGSHLLTRVLKNVAEETKVRIGEVTLHVQVGSPAFEFYKKFGFEVVERVENYYSGLDETDAFFLRKVVPQPRLKSAQQQQNQRPKASGAKNGKKK
ncbi:acetyltransferase [Trypanosoma theileri]|uniref:Acetyltransferase n=1 Tax=Trypanosoma theileri TaxID=67003 RepID=A0A1X0P8P4_9TRYP|nr:acetyltransferase [Trypanosoma theileri]ORC93306.1 acetyltransferase [Trypanosoma theileri]